MRVRGRRCAMALNNDPRYDKGVKKLFGAYTEEDADGERTLYMDALESLLQDFEICPQLCERAEVAEALQQTANPDREGMSFHEFKKFLKKVGVNEFKKKDKYGVQFPDHDARHNALLQYLRCDDVDALLDHARACKKARRQRAHKQDARSSSRNRPSRSREGLQSDDGVKPAETMSLEERIKQRQEEAIAANRKKHEEEDARRKAEVDRRLAHASGPPADEDEQDQLESASRTRGAASDDGFGAGARPRSGGGVRPQSAGRARGAGGGERAGFGGWGGGGEDALRKIDERTADDSVWWVDGKGEDAPFRDDDVVRSRPRGGGEGGNGGAERMILDDDDDTLDGLIQVLRLRADPGLGFRACSFGLIQGFGLRA